MKISRYLAVAIPVALASAGIGGVASAEDAHGKDVGPVSVFCNNALHQSLVDAGGGNGGLLGQIAKGLGIGVGGPGSGGDGNHPGSTDSNPPSHGDNEGGDGEGNGMGANDGSADGGNGGHVEESSQQVIAGNRCATGPETHLSQHKDTNVYNHSFNQVRKEKFVAEHR